MKTIIPVFPDKKKHIDAFPHPEEGIFEARQIISSRHETIHNVEISYFNVHGGYFNVRGR